MHTIVKRLMLTWIGMGRICSNNALWVLLDSEEEYCIGTPYGYCEQAIWIPLCRRRRTASAKLGPTLQGVVGTWVPQTGFRATLLSQGSDLVCLYKHICTPLWELGLPGQDKVAGISAHNCFGSWHLFHHSAVSLARPRLWVLVFIATVNTNVHDELLRRFRNSIYTSSS